MPDFPENPWMTEGCAPYHYAVNAVTVEALLRLLRRVDIAIANDGNVHTRIGLDLTYQRPVGLALVHLATGAAVYGQSADSRILETFRERDNDFRAVVPAQTGLGEAAGHENLTK